MWEQTEYKYIISNTCDTNLTLDFPVHIFRLSMELFILYFNGSHIEISKS